VFGLIRNLPNKASVDSRIYQTLNSKNILRNAVRTEEKVPGYQWHCSITRVTQSRCAGIVQTPARNTVGAYCNKLKTQLVGPILLVRGVVEILMFFVYEYSFNMYINKL